MSEAECVDFCKRAVAHAFARDGSSGGSIRMVIVTEQGMVLQHPFHRLNELRKFSLVLVNMMPAHLGARHLPWSR